MSLLLPIIFLMAATLIFVPLAKRYAANTVLGYLIAGLLLGSSVSGLIEDPQLIKQLLHFGMIAVMFFVGFAFRPQQLWLERRGILKNSGLQLLIITLVLIGACFLLFNDVLTSLILGCALALSAVILPQQLLQQKQQLNSKLGQATLATLQFQAFVAVILIVLFPLLEDTASTRHGIAYFAAIIATFSGLFLASRYLVRPAFRFLARKNSIHLIAVLSLLVLVSVILIMDILNIHILIGAFLGGLLLAETEFKSEVERILEPFKDAATGLFFLAIGLGLSLQPLVQTPLLIITSIFGLVVIKAVVIGAISYYQQRHAKLSTLFAITLAQSGELSFILLKLAESENLLGKDLLEPAFLIIFGSMLLTPLLYELFDRKILPILLKNKVAVTDADVPQHPILIIGFGRFGQVIARALHAQGKQFSVIDSNQPDADFIEQYGHRFFDADVTQVENLRAAGIEYCKLLIVAIDDVEDSMNLARHLRLNYPDLSLFVRARDRHHAHLLSDLGVQHIWRETYASSLNMAQQALIETGLSIKDAHIQIERFKQEDEQLLMQQQWAHDQQEILESYPNAMAELEYLFANAKTLHTDRVSNDQNTQSDANSPNEAS
ncbi:cation:proton antiporter [Acinetobacter sp. Ac_5812]|uniref:cation:proton antiporter domain-containing protein n=1 Tax=Acinetobacter sp. Ac_5812 TaxID=1848937 RepID=UPI00148F71D8|nr:cation:proton antiporter [Acinetobacter sp. Ac_5812]NNP68229.1 potassium transporter [Acinetobacter sp. Ac_5812]